MRMTLRKHDRHAAAARRDEMMRLAHEMAEPAADRAVRAFLRALMAQMRKTLGGNPALTAAAAAGILNVQDVPAEASARPFWSSRGVLTAAAAPIAHNLFDLGQARGWWTDAIRTDLEPVLAQIWQAGYSDTSTVASSTDSVATYLANVRDRLVPALTPGVPDHAFDLVRQALTEELAAGSTIGEIGDRLAAEFSWSDSTKYWADRKSKAYDEIDSILDQIGQPGDYAREAAKRTDPRVKALREIANDATNRIDASENTWRGRAQNIGRTEAGGAFNYGAHEALRDEGAETKAWLATPGPRTRPWHAAADGQEVPIDQPFIVNGEEMMFPGDPSGSVDNVCQCRCSLIGGGLLG